MRITESMLVPAAMTDQDADVRRCKLCAAETFHVPQSVMVLSRSGARRMRLWVCEKHPLPDTVTDDPDEA